jgi:hypothetical protein
MQRYVRDDSGAGRWQTYPSAPNPDNDDDHDDDEAPATPTDEPPPIPVLDPPSEDRPHPPMTVAPL